MKRTKRKEIYQDEWLAFYQDETVLPNGTTGTYAWADRKDGVGVVVVTTDNRIMLNHEYRYVIDKYCWEIPGGGIDKGENPIEAAKRELYEETGIQSDKFEQVGAFYPLNSFNTELVTVFYTVIDPVPLTDKKSESSEEFGKQKYVTFKEALEMIDKGAIEDALSANAIQIVIRKILQ